MDELQIRFWNHWNQTYREKARLDPATAYRVDSILRAVDALELSRDSRILEVGCGTGWMCAKLASFGNVTGIDLADEVIERARLAHPEVEFVAGDFMVAEVGGHFDLVVTMEVLSHVADHGRFVSRIHALLKPGGHLLMTSQNRYVWSRRSDVSPVAPGQLRRWFSRGELRDLLQPYFRLEQVTTLLPAGHLGALRLANSPKLNALVGSVVGHARLLQWKERIGLGQAIFVLASRR